MKGIPQVVHHHQGLRGNYPEFSCGFVCYQGHYINKEIEALQTFQGDQLAQGILTKVDDLRKYSNEIEKELWQLELDSIPDYMNEAENFGSLYYQIETCIQLLQKFEDLFITFQKELVGITADIKLLQDASVLNNTRIGNRQAVGELLNRFVNDLSIPKELHKGITSNDVNEFYVRYLQALNRKISFCEVHLEGGTIACADVSPKLKSLESVALNKVSQYISKQIETIKDLESLRRMQAEVSNVSYCYQFLFKHGPTKAKTVVALYVDAASRIYTVYCKSYLTSLLKCQYELAAKTDTLGSPVTRQRIISPFKSDPKKSPSTNIFSIADRFNVLQNMESPPMTPPNPKTEQHLFESLFRSIVYLLMEFATAETMFCNDFFLINSDVANLVFYKLIGLYIETLHNYLENSFDAIGIAIVMCIVEKYFEMMGRRRAPCLNKFSETAMTKLITRFKFVVENHLESVRQASARTFAVNTVAVHLVTRRYAEFLGSLLSLSGNSSADSGQPRALETVHRVVVEVLLPLRKEMEAFLLRMTECFPEPTKKTLFLINNYDLVLQVLEKRKVVSDDVTRFNQLREDAIMRHSADLIQSMPYFANLISFVDRTRPHKNDPTKLMALPDFNNEYVETLLQDFVLHWKGGLEALKHTVTSSFTNFEVGNSIFQNTIERVLAYYQELVQIILTYMKDLRRNQYFVGETEIAYEMKKLGGFFDSHV
ncbi:vacuolar protein sorting-associated protein 52 A [Pelomyxa schiedti]|nr:vacuolar protein sorting-associated protein 52 A [Pelomyxa schiedti]